jgi:tetratricopeptide (TPR) repeat protein
VKRSPVTFETLSHLLPEDEEFEGLRLALLGVATPDPDKEWSKSSAYATVDKRVVSREQVEQALTESEGVLRRNLQERFSTTREMFAAFWAARDDEVARHLVELGEQEEGLQRFGPALRAYTAALNVALPLADKGPQILALRRIARLALSRGDVEDAVLHYRRSADLAADAGDVVGEVTALTGVGNARSVQGWWQEAESCYRQALGQIELAGLDEEMELERGQLLNNLALTAIRSDRRDEARAILHTAREVWGRVDAPNDRAIWHNNQALLLEQEGDTEGAQAERLEATRLDITSEKRAVLAIDLAQGFATAGKLLEAGRWGREAEQHAIAARSPYSLGHMYRGLGNIARAVGDSEGFTFFEKALEIARVRELPFLEAETLVDYALLRVEMAGGDEARAYLERACDIYRRLGAPHELAGAERLLEGAIPTEAPLSAD